MEPRSSPVSESAGKSGSTRSKATLPSLKDIKQSWSTNVGFDFWAEGNNLVDHLANERTWHNWLAASNAVAWMGVVVSQMSRINRVVRPEHARMLRNKACLCQALAIFILLIGSYRFFREQGAINGTGTRASQWSLLAAGLLTLILLCSFFGIIIVSEVDR